MRMFGWIRKECGFPGYLKECAITSEHYQNFSLFMVNSSPSMSYCSPRGLPKNWRFWTVVLEKTLESPLDCKEIQPVHPKGNQSWIFIGRADVEAETPILWPPDAKNWLTLKRCWCWERLKAGGEGDDRRWDGWMASPAQWTGVWASSRSWWWTEKPVMLQSMRLQRAGHDWVT